MFKPPDWQWRQTPDVGLVVSRRLGRSAAGPGRAASGRMARSRACSRRSSRGRIASSTACDLPQETRSTSSIFWCRTGEPCFGSGFAAARGGTRASARSTWPRSECRRSRRSRSESSGSGSSCSRITWSRWRFRTRFRSTSSSSAGFRSGPSRCVRSIRQKLARAVAVMTARLHDAGLLHHDFHPGNILVRLDEPTEPELFMIDLDALRKMPPRHLEAGPAEPGAARSLTSGCEAAGPTAIAFLKTYLRNRTGAAARRAAGLPGRSKTRRGSGRSGSGGAGAGVPVVEQVLRGLSRAARPGAWPRAIWTRRKSSRLLDDPDLPFRAARRPRSSRTRGPRRSPRRRWWCGAADSGHLQAVQPQEVARPAPDPVSSVASVAVVASRPGPRQPRDPDAAKPGVPVAPAIVQERPLLLVPAARNLPDHRQGSRCRQTWRRTSARCSRALPPDARGARIRSLTVIARPADPIAARSLALAPRSEGVEHPDQGRIRRSDVISSA